MEMHSSTVVVVAVVAVVEVVTPNKDGIRRKNRRGDGNNDAVCKRV